MHYFTRLPGHSSISSDSMDQTAGSITCLRLLCTSQKEKCFCEDTFININNDLTNTVMEWSIMLEITAFHLHHSSKNN